MSNKEINNILGSDVKTDDEVILSECEKETDQEDWLKVYERPYTPTTK